MLEQNSNAESNSISIGIVPSPTFLFTAQNIDHLQWTPSPPETCVLGMCRGLPETAPSIAHFQHLMIIYTKVTECPTGFIGY